MVGRANVTNAISKLKGAKTKTKGLKLKGSIFLKLLLLYDY